MMSYRWQETAEQGGMTAWKVLGLQRPVRQQLQFAAVAAAQQLQRRRQQQALQLRAAAPSWP
jgi:hypothetical protein